MSFVQRLFGRQNERQSMLPLYQRVVSLGRDPAWYRDGEVPDTLEGRFDVVATVLALILLRLEREGDRARRDSVLLTEIFIDDMDSSLRELGAGDMVVGKKVGKLVGALGGRLGALREAADDPVAFAAAVRRNVFRDAPPSEEKAAWVAARLADLRTRLAATPLEALRAGELA